VKWGDCDPAGVVYTPRFSDYVVETFLTFSERLIGSPLQERLQALDLGLPAKAMSMVFKRSLWPDEVFEIEVTVRAIRTRTFDLSFSARTLEGQAVFDATMSPICVRPGTRESCPIPDPLLDRLQAQREAVP
jgi:acyl-CoA thioester hydrolase